MRTNHPRHQPTTSPPGLYALVAVVVLCIPSAVSAQEQGGSPFTPEPTPPTETTLAPANATSTPATPSPTNATSSPSSNGTTTPAPTTKDSSNTTTTTAPATSAPATTESTRAPESTSSSNETTKTPSPGEATPSPTNSSAATCLAPEHGNLYKRASCASACYDSFCSCLNTYYTPAPIVDSEEPNDFSRLTCVTEGYLWVSCDYYTSCAAELIECVNAAASSGCKDTLKLALLGAAVDDDFTSTTVYDSCQYSACDVFGRQSDSYTARYYGKCPVTADGLNRMCVSPTFFRGSLYLRAPEQWNVFWYLQYPYSYYQQQTDTLKAALQSALSSLFPGLNVILQSVTSDAVLRVEFVVNGSASDDAIVSGMQNGQLTSGWLSPLQSYNLTVDYFGPRLYRHRSSSCFSFDRTIPYVSVSGVPLRVDILGRNDTSCTSLNLGTSLTLTASRADDLREWNLEWNYQHLFRDARNKIAGTLNITSALSGSAALTVYCPANGTRLSITARTATYSFYVGEVWCVQPFPQPNRFSPDHITVWLSTTSERTLANTLGAVFANAGPSTTINATAGTFGSVAMESFASFAAFQSRANAFVDGLDGLYVADPCEAFENGTVFPFAKSTNLLVLAGNYYKSTCSNSEASAALATVAQLVRDTDVIVTDSSVGPSAFSDPLSRPIAVGFPDSSSVAVGKTLERYQAYRFERQPTSCTGAVVTVPPALDLDMMEEGILRWNNACNVAKCCIGEYCSPAGDRNCTLPMAAAGLDQTIKLVTTSGSTIPTASRVSIAYWTRRLYVSTWSQYTEDDNTVKVDVYRYTKGALCFRLLCVNSTDPFPAIRDMAPFGSTLLCNPNMNTYYYYYSWTYYWFTVYGWLQYDFAWGTLTFDRPSASMVPQGCAAVVLNYFENRTEFFSLNRPFAGGAVGPKEGASLVSGGTIAVTNVVPVPPAATAADRVAWCRNWAQDDSLNTALEPRLAEMRNCFPCPAFLETVMPRSMWRVWGWGDWWYNYYYQESGNPSQSCFETYGSWQGSPLSWHKRCCYQGTAVGSPLIPGYPSLVEATNQWGTWPDYTREMILSRIADKNPRVACCSAANASGYSCGYYTSRRSVGPGTTDIFRPLSQLPTCNRTWQVPPPWGWGWGDPYCTTFDGAGFECNFWGEVVWTGCGGWRVHVSAVPLSSGAAATVVNGVAVREGNDTVVVVRNNVTGEPNVTFNGNRVESPQELNSGSLMLSWGRNEQNRTTVRITSRSGHEVAVDALSSFFAVRAAADWKCVGKCVGLLGNCDGNKNDDLVSRNGSIRLPLNASGEEVYAKIVLSWVVPQNETLFIEPVSTPPGAGNDTTGSFVPTFITPALLAACPALCNGNPGCCLDASVGGAEFAKETVQAVNTAVVLANQTVPLGYNWPPSLSFQARVEALIGLAINTTITATDADGVESLAADVCGVQGSNVTCTTLPEGNTTRRLRIETSATRNITITIVAVDAKGASRTSYMMIVSKPPPPPPANSAAVTFNLTGTGAWGATEVYSLRDSLSADLAQVVNEYYGYTTATRRRSSITVQAPPFTTAQDFSLASVVNQRTEQPVQVAVSYYVVGEYQDEASSRAVAVNSQKTLVLPRFRDALVQLVPGATLGTPTSPSSTSASPSQTSSPNSVTAAPTLNPVLSPPQVSSRAFGLQSLLAAAVSVLLAAVLLEHPLL